MKKQKMEMDIINSHCAGNDIGSPDSSGLPSDRNSPM